MTPDIALIHLSSQRWVMSQHLAHLPTGWDEREQELEASCLRAEIEALDAAIVALRAATWHIDPLVAALAARMIRDPALINLVVTGWRKWPAKNSLEDLLIRAEGQVQDWENDEAAWDGLAPQPLELEKSQAAVVALEHFLNQETLDRQARERLEEDGPDVRLP